jgi:7-cyano-7-deazaguanine tRNA-ribosyltransferase
MASVKNLPDNKPRHLMGAGHPMVFALCVAMGCDLFDSAAYILYAEDDRLLTTTGTIKLENLHEMPCSCEVCSKYTPDELRKLPKKERVELIAAHNLHVSFAELRRIRQAIYEGTLMELVELRCRAHPALLDAVRELGNYSEDLEKYDPSVKKSAFFYTGPESLKRATVTRHLEKLRNQPKKKDLIILGGGRKPYSKYYQGRLGRFHTLTGSQEQVNPEEADFMVLDIPFGLTPLDLDETYPLAQNVAPKILDDDSIEFLINTLAEFSEYYNQVLIHARPVREYGLDLPEYEHSHDIRFKKDDTRKIKAIANYQFQSDIGEQLFDGDLNIEKSKKTGKIRHIYDGEELIANMRASDANFVLSDEGAKRLHKNINYPNNRVVVDSSVEEFARDGKSVFSKFVVDIDSNIRAQDEVLITNSNDDLLAYGKVLLNPKEINDFNTGQAVKVRKGFKL